MMTSPVRMASAKDGVPYCRGIEHGPVKGARRLTEAGAADRPLEEPELVLRSGARTRTATRRLRAPEPRAEGELGEGVGLTLTPLPPSRRATLRKSAWRLPEADSHMTQVSTGLVRGGLWR